MRKMNRNFGMALTVCALIGLALTVAAAARSSTAECQHMCNEGFAFCDVDCDGGLELCLAGCNEEPNPADCRKACKAVSKACHADCGEFKNECKNGCPRGKESPSEPLP